MQGVILGTAAYMSPEQARGKAVDKRTDVWAFGCVLYELLTGKPAFDGEDVTEILAAVVKTEPDWNRLPKDIPPNVRALLRRCLQKNARQRIHDAGDVRIEIDEAIVTPALTEPVVGGISQRSVQSWIALAGFVCLVVAILTGVAAWNLKPTPRTGPQAVIQLAATLPPGQELFATSVFPALALSPDGRNLVYVARRAGSQQLYVRSMDNLESKLIPGTENGLEPFFSPDGQWVGFFADGKLKKVALSGGSPLTICDAAGAWGGSWGPDDAIYFAPGSFSALLRVPAKGGSPQPFTKLDSKKGEISHRWPQVLPGGKAVLFTVWTGPGWGEKQVQLQRLGDGERRVLVQAGHTGFYVPTGHLVYYQSGQGTLMAVPFSLSDLQVSGSTPVVVAEGVRESSEGAQYTFSENGSLAYVPGDSHEMYERVFVTVDRTGKEELLKPAPGPYQSPDFSPDGKSFAFDTQGAKSEIWEYDVTRTIAIKLPSENGSDQIPIWTPDGKRLAYRATRAGTRNIFWRMADGTGNEERLTTGDGNQTPGSWSPSGQVLAFTDLSPVAESAIWILELSDHKQQPFIQTRFRQGKPQFSPDGHSLAFNSNESGRDEVYVQPFPGPGAKIQISTDGGNDPRWNRNGKELFYRNGTKVFAASVVVQPSFSASKPTLLFDGPYEPGNGAAFFTYDVSPDGQHFLMIKPSEQPHPATQINVVLNWFEELKQKVPTGKK